MKKYLRKLQDNVVRSKIKKAKIRKADVFFIVKKLPRCFKTWKIFVKTLKERNSMKRNASMFHREVLETKYFYIWWNKFEQTRELRTMERMAMMQHTESTLRHHFHIWATKTRSILSANHSDVLARVHYRHALLHTAMTSWKKFYKMSMERQRKQDYAESYHRTGTLAGAWLSWLRYVEQKRAKRKQISEIESKYSRKVVEKCFEGWKVFVRMTRQINLKASAQLEAKRNKILRETFTKWRLATLENIQKKSFNEKARNHRNNQLKLAVFLKWRKWSVVHNYRKTQIKEKVDFCVNTLNFSSRKRYFHRWVLALSELGKEKKKEKLAVEFYRKKVSKVVFNAWLLFRFLALKKLLMQRQANIFSCQRILRTSFSTWSSHFKDSVSERKKTGDALWLWSVTLQGRCLDGWRAFTAERSRKKQRFAQALKMRSHDMVTHGCTQILRYHADKLAERTNMAAKLQVQSSHTAYHLAWKYGMIWLNKTRHRMDERKAFQTIRTWSPQPNMDILVKPSLPTCTSFEVAKVRAAPRLPDFLDESLNREGLLLSKYSTSHATHDDRNDDFAVSRTMINEKVVSHDIYESRDGNHEPQILLPPSAFTLNHGEQDHAGDANHIHGSNHGYEWNHMNTRES
uniref:Sfi1 spindle body domain-containing protein n=2 Tax=Ciona intestinalis TaxID=7719 RepID=H2XZY6_CIOIN